MRQVLASCYIVLEDVETSGGDEKLLLVGNPTGDLIGSAIEYQSIKKRLSDAKVNVVGFVGAQAAVNAVLAAATDSTLLHFSGHAVFDQRSPLDSAFRLGCGTITLNDVLSRIRLERHPLVILNGCEMGRSNMNMTDDLYSFAVGFLLTGARCAISSVWANTDVPGALLIDKFYSNWLSGMKAGTALHFAQNWLRGISRVEELERAVGGVTDCLEDRVLARAFARAARQIADSTSGRPFESPVHWASLICSGMGF